LDLFFKPGTHEQDDLNQVPTESTLSHGLQNQVSTKLTLSCGASADLVLSCGFLHTGAKRKAIETSHSSVNVALAATKFLID
jgi:hypothetical protein